MNLAAAFALVREKHGIAAPNPIFLQELRRLEKDVFGDWTTEKLVPLDEFRCPMMDWSESLYVLLANIHRAGVNLNDERCVINRWFEEVDQDQPYALEQKFKVFVITGLGIQGDDDTARTEALGTIVKQVVLDSGKCSVSELKQMLQIASFGDELEGLVKDVHAVKSWFHAFAADL
jgi:hypothetical protein